MYQVFGELDNYNMMIKLKKNNFRYVSLYVMLNILCQKVVIYELG
jgi:hypothetical protein